ncbi:MAG: putative DNA-binding domain-containing protein [Pseudomonadales bacterium]|nr:putative DNA-binding domain-containing protein [Pseudomonadales bacterium]
MPELNLKEQQQLFTAYLRDPANNLAPAGIEDRRLTIYRDLFFNNIEGFLASAFPVFKSLHDEQSWLNLVREFFAQHRCETPYFLSISEEFLAYIDNDTLPLHQRFPFAKELCHYEWVELALDVAEDDQQQGLQFDANGDVLAHPVCLSPLAWPLIYSWPVHEIGPEHIPAQLPEQPSCLVVYRTRLDKIEFLQTNPATIQLLQLIKENPELKGQDILECLAEMLGQAGSSAVIDYGLQTLEQLKTMGIVLGTVNSN